MKTMFLLFIIITASLKILLQSKEIETGLYLVLSQDSCTAQNNVIEYLLDTLCLEQNPVRHKNQRWMAKECMS